MMEKKKELLFISLAILFQFPVIVILIIGSEDSGDITGLVPINSTLIDLLYIFFISPLLMILFIELTTIISAFLFFKLHDIIKIKRYNYAIFKMENLPLKIRDIIIRTLTLGLFAFTIGTLITEFVPHDIIITTHHIDDIQMSFITLSATMFILPFLILFFLPIWLLRDAGIVCSKKKFKEGYQKLPDIEGVYRVYNSYILGYIGIATIIAIALLIYTDIFLIIQEGGKDVGLAIPIFFAPFIGMAISLIPLVYYNFRKQKLVERFNQKLHQKSIKTVVENINDI